MRYGTTSPCSTARPIATMATLRRALGLTRRQAEAVALAHLLPPSNCECEAAGSLSTKWDKMRTVLRSLRDRDRAIGTLSSPARLRKDAALSLADRARAYSRVNRRARISKQTLGREFQRLKVRKKAVKARKVCPRWPFDRQADLFPSVKEKMDSALRARRRVVFVDEAVVSRDALQKTAFAARGDNISLRSNQLEARRVHVVAAISRENGLEAFSVSDRAVNSALFLEAMRDCLRHRGRFAIFGDNVSYHLSRETTAGLSQMGTFFIANVPYAPEISPVERLFSTLKRRYGSLRLDALLKGRRVDVHGLLHQAARQIPKKAVVNICELGLR